MERDYTQSRTNTFPVHVFPDRLQRIIRELHDSNGFPVDYNAASMMAAISVAISNDTFNRVERITRIFDGAGYNVGNFVEHIINEHLDNNSANYESWFTVISKSF